jgi:hypothetical protein
VTKTVNMTDDQLEAGIASSQAAMDMLYEQRQALDKKIDQHRKKNERLVKEKAARQFANMQTTGVIDWATLLTFAPHEPYYELLKKELNKRFPDWVVVNSGYWPDAIQYALRVGFERDNQDQVKRAAALIEEVLPAMKVSDIEQNIYKFQIMDRGLSEYETYLLICSANTMQWFVVTNRDMKYGRQHKHGPYNKVEDALILIANQYWYRTPEGTNEDDE